MLKGICCICSRPAVISCKLCGKLFCALHINVHSKNCQFCSRW